jgi:transposase-like protein
MNKAQEGRQEYWKQVIAEQEKSGQSVRAYCREHGIGEHSLYMWRQRLGREMPVSFALVETNRAAEPAVLELRLASGDLLRVPADSKTLGLVLGVLREQA